MAKFKVSKKLADKIMKSSGDTSGISMQPDAKYIIDNYGKKGLEQIEKCMKDLGYGFEFKKLDLSKMYNQGYQVLMVLLAKELFNLSKEDIIKFGENNMKINFLLKILVNYFMSPKNAFEIGMKDWNKHSTLGKLKAYGPYMKKKYARATLSNYPLHPDFVTFMSGFLKGFTSLAVGKKNVRIKQTKFEHKGDSCHEFIISWD